MNPRVHANGFPPHCSQVHKTSEKPVTNPLRIPIAAAKKAIGCATTKAYQLISDGKLDARKLGTRTMITGESLRAFVESLPPAAGNMAPRKTSGELDSTRRFHQSTTGAK
jgi:hypothetical protein